MPDQEFGMKFTNRPELLEGDSTWDKPFYFPLAKPGEQPQAGTGIITNPETGEPAYPSIDQQIAERQGESVKQQADQQFDRARFRGEVFKVLGGNPFMLDPNDALKQSTKNLPALFNYVFQGKIAWADMGKMNKAQREYWEDQKKIYRAKKFNEAKMQKDKLVEQYKFMMGEFDAEKRDFEAQRARKEKAPDRIQVARPDGKKEWFERDKTTGEWKPTGLMASEPKASTAAPKVPLEVTEARKIIKKYAPPELPDALRGVYHLMDEKTKANIDQIYGRAVDIPADEKESYDNAVKIEKWYQKKITDAGMAAIQGEQEKVNNIKAQIDKRRAKEEAAPAAAEKTVAPIKKAAGEESTAKTISKRRVWNPKTKRLE